MRWFFALLLLCSSAFGQIEMPDQVEVGDKLVATVNAKIPDGASFDGGWNITCNGADCLIGKEELKKANSIGIWIKEPGSYTVSYAGFWLLTKEVTFTDGAGNDVTITSYLGHGFINESKGVTVGTPVPPPPPPPPKPEGPWKVWFLENPQSRDDLSQSQQALLVSQSYREQLQREGHEFQEVVQPPSITSPPTRLQAVVQAYKTAGVNLPAVAIADMGGGNVRVFPLPANMDDLTLLLNEPPE